MKKIFFFLTFIICVMQLAVPAIAQERSGRDQWMNEIRQYRRTYFTKELRLSKEQQNNFFPIYDEMEEQMNRIEEDVRVMERRIAEADDASDVEYEKATEAIYEARVSQAELEKNYLEKLAVICFF